MSDLISRQAAIDALGEKPLAWTEDEYELGLQNQWQSDADALKALPAVQPQRKTDEWCTDCREYDKKRHCCPRFNRVIRQTLSEQTEVIRCNDCIHNGSFDTDCPIKWNGKEYCSFAESED